MTCRKGARCNGYILCTAARNEEANIPDLLQDVSSQTVRPALWVIVDDSSEDGTAGIVEDFSRRHGWVRLLKYGGQRHPRKLMHISKVKRFAAGTAVSISEAEGIHYCRIGILDADIRVERDFYLRMLSRLREDRGIGLLGAGILSPSAEKGLRLEQARADLPGSATMLCRRECFDEIGGVPGDMYPEDAIMIARAKLAGWRTERSSRIMAVQKRRSGSKEGMAEGYMQRGERIYFLRYPLAYLVMRVALIAFRESPFMALAFLSGYARVYLEGAERLEDRGLVEYFSKHRFREAVKYNLGAFLKKKIWGRQWDNS